MFNLQNVQNQFKIGLHTNKLMVDGIISSDKYEAGKRAIRLA